MKPYDLYIKYKGDWADEMNVYGFAIITKDEWDDIIDHVKKFFVENSLYTFYIGTNEEIEYEDFDSWFRDFKVTEMSYGESIAVLAVLSRIDKYEQVKEKGIRFKSGFFPIPTEG